jgi:hypothetical protein
VREHEIYVVGHHEGALQKAKDGMKDRASSTTPNQRTRTNASAGSSTVTLTIPSFVQDKKILTLVAGGLALVVLVLAVLVLTKRPSTPSDTTVAAAPGQPAEAATVPAAKPATAPTPVPEAAKPEPAAPAKPETKVLEPTPAASQVPAPAPAFEPKEPKGEGKKIATEAAKPPTEAKADKGEASKSGLPPATLVFAVSPWGEIFVNGRSRGVTPPMKSLKLEPGKYKVEIRNTTFAAHIENLELKARDELTVRHKFQ